LNNRSDVRAVLLLILTVCVFFIPVLTGMRGIFHDDLAMEVFSRKHFAAANLQQGVVPLWDPQTWCGAIPFYARYFADTYYLPLWPFYVCSDTTNPQSAYFVHTLLPLILHYCLAGTGMYILLRRFFQCRAGASFFGALLYVFSPAFMYAYVWGQVVAIEAWAPWLLYAYVSAVRKFTIVRVLLPGIILSFLITAAVPNYAHFFILIWFGVMVLLQATPSGMPVGRLFQRQALVTAATVCIGFGLSAVYILSSIDGFQYMKEHIPLTLQSALQDPVGSLPLAYLATLFVPHMFDNVTGEQMLRLIPEEPVLYWEANLSGGLFVSFLVFVCCMSLLARRPGQDPRDALWRRCAVFGLVLYAVSLTAALGKNTPVYKWTIGLIPFIRDFPRPIHYRVIQCFSAALLGALGINALCSNVSWRRPEFLMPRAGLYLACACGVIASLFIFPLSSRQVSSFRVFGDFGAFADGYIESGASAGQFAPPEAVTNLGIYFDAPSSGEIRYADSLPEAASDGMIARTYSVAANGWHGFDLRIPGSKFVWIVQKAGNARIGFKRFRDAPIDGWVYDPSQGWVARPDVNVFALRLERTRAVRSMASWLTGGGAAARPVIYSALYFLLASGLLAWVCRYGKERSALFIAVFAGMEIAAFGAIAFYGGTFAHGDPSENHRRSPGPADNAFYKRAVKAAAGMMRDRSLRIAATEPYHDNFFRLTDVSALMGYEMHPLERRFKAAIERAYGQPMDYRIYYSEPRPLPENWPFLNHWSVGYLLSKSPVALFPRDNVEPLTGVDGYYLHRNGDALNRWYFSDAVETASEQTQCERLVSGDLTKAVYVSAGDVEPYMRSGIATDFSVLQRMNTVLDADFRDPNSIRLTARVQKASMLVFSELWYPGWTAFIDGIPARVYRVNYCQRGVWVAEGAHSIALIFRPEAWVRGARISAATIFFILVVLMIKYVSCFLKPRKASL